MGKLFKLCFSQMDGAVEDLASEIFWLLGALYKGGQIADDYLLLKEARGYAAFVTADSAQALAPQRQSVYADEQRDYRNIDSLWMSCLADRFTRRQLVSPQSQLFRSGMELRQALEKVLQRPVYHFIHYPDRHPSKCPLCAAPWEKAPQSPCAALVCRTCRIAADEP